MIAFVVCHLQAVELLRQDVLLGLALHRDVPDTWSRVDCDVPPQPVAEFVAYDLDVPVWPPTARAASTIGMFVAL